MRYIIELIYGDPSSDGHGMSASDSYKSNYKTQDIEKAVAQIEKANNFTFTEDICAEYGECTIDKDRYNQFVSMGIDIGDYVEDYGDDTYYVHNFTGLYLAIAKLALPDLQTEFTKVTTDSLAIGGYGMFEN